MKKQSPTSRRRFITQLAGLIASSSFWPQFVHAGGKEKIFKAIPSSGEKLPVIGMGTSRTFDVGSDSQTINHLAGVLQTFFDLGGSMIDSSPMYGNAEQVTGELLKIVKHKQKLFAATKVWIDGQQEGVEQMQRSMTRMGVKRFDLMQIHNLRDWELHLETLKKWKAQGKVRYIGITTSHGRFHGELEKILQTEPFDFVQFSYNIQDRTVERRLLPIAQQQKIATIINRPFQRGELFARVKGKKLPAWAAEFDCSSWAQFFLKFVVSHPGVTCAIPATSKLKHMQDNMGAGFGALPDAAMRKKMLAYFNNL